MRIHTLSSRHWVVSLFVLAALTLTATVPPVQAQQTDPPKKAQADDPEALRKQIKALQAQVEELKQLNDKLRKEAADAAARARNERDRAEVSRAEALRQRERAEAQFRQARQAVDQLFTHLAGQALPTPAPPPEKLRQHLLEEAKKFYQQIHDGKEPKKPAAGAKELREKAQELIRDADADLAAGKLVQAEVTFRQAAELLRKLVVEIPQAPGNRYDLARATLRLGEVAVRTGRVQEGEKSVRQAVALLEALVREAPADGVYRGTLGAGYGVLARLLRTTGRVQEAEQAEQRAKALAP